ncbi:hypothetical protein IKG06_02465 [Candidatus Saccharibacteria bacterium]|nr:hypothetical protein [Candidatus Saccharibacteria bacterium]
MKKYVFTGKTRPSASGGLLHQIRAVHDIPSILVKAGDLGGWIENEDNLSHSGDCWVFPNAEVYEDARVYEDASIYEGAVSGQARVHGNAKLYKNVAVYEYADISGDTKLIGPIHIYGEAKLNNPGTIDKSIHGCPA